MGMTLPFERPQRPYCAIAPKYILVFEKYKNCRMRAKEILEAMLDPKKIMPSPNLRYKIFEDKLKKKDLFSNTNIIDINCRKFPVTGISIKGYERDIFNLFGLIGKRRYYFEYDVGEPVQLTFEEAREEIIEHICSHRWVGQTGGSHAHFRKLHGSKKNMAELMENISFYGKWPF
jgi:hypothetical protein